MKNTNSNILKLVGTFLSSDVQTYKKPKWGYESNKFKYMDGIEMEYDTHYKCHSGSDCCDNDYCRCGKIENARVESIDPELLIQSIITTAAGRTKKDSKEDSIIDLYCLNRLIYNSSLISPDSWEVNIVGGYYGEETNGYEPSDLNDVKALSKNLLEVSNMKNIDKIKFILKNEYGFLLSELEKFNTAVVKTVSTSNVILNNKDYSKKLDKLAVDKYKGYSLPRAICIKDGDKYKVIDGYHRMTSAIINNIEKIDIIVLGK